MNSIDRFVNGEVALNVRDSLPKDIDDLSDYVETHYPDLSKETTTIYYPTINDFTKHHDCELCFYNKDYTTWDGYKIIDTWHYEDFTILTAKEILDSVCTIDIDENEIMELFT